MLSLYRITTHYREKPEHGILFEELATSVEDAERREEVRAMGTTIAQAFRAEGRAEGRQEGRAEAMAQTLARLLVRKFGPLPAGVAERVGALRDEAKLGALLDRILTATQMEEMGLGE